MQIHSKIIKLDRDIEGSNYEPEYVLIDVDNDIDIKDLKLQNNTLNFKKINAEFELLKLGNQYVANVFTKQTIMFDINIPIHSQLSRPPKGTSVVYLIYCRTSKKLYIGKAANYSSGKLYGASGRWKNHISTATSGKNIGCPHLNNAIRLYGSDDFIVTTIKQALTSEINEWEKFFILAFDTLSVNGKGYNIESGGTRGKEVAEETRQKQSKKRKNRIMTEESKIKLSQSKMGKKKDVERVNPADNNLPTHMSAIRRKNGKIFRYQICFPVGINEGSEYIQKGFQNTKNPEKAYELAIKYLEELKIQYKDRSQKIEDMLEKNMQISIQKKMEKIHKKDTPQYITPRTVANKKDGYIVEGYPDWEGNPYPKKEFTTLSCNNKNLGAAKRYIKELEIKNKDALFEEYIPDELLNLKTDRNKPRPKNIKHLPDYIAYTYENGLKTGYVTIGFKTLEGKIVKKKFTGNKISMEDKYKLVTDYLINLIKTNNKL